jgi:signal transduction histidine kinase
VLTTVTPCVVLLLRDGRPLRAALGVAGLFAAYPLPDARAPEVLTQALCLLVATYYLALHADRRTALLGLAAVVVGGTVHASGLDEYDAVSAAVNGAWALPPWAIGRAVRSRESRALSAEDGRAEAERLAAIVEAEAIDAERRRIARELHDVVAHAVTVMVLQARGARHCLELDPRAAREALDAIEEVGGEALQELRQMLRLLPTDAAASLDPRPGLSDAPALVETVRRAGLEVELRVEGRPLPLAAGADVSAYRVLQEAFTNAMRYGDGRATAVVSHEPDQVRLEVVNRLAGARPPAQGSGRGLVGSRERVTVFGGTFDAGVQDDRFRVCAVLPRGTAS